MFSATEIQKILEESGTCERKVIFTPDCSEIKTFWLEYTLNKSVTL